MGFWDSASASVKFGVIFGIFVFIVLALGLVIAVIYKRRYGGHQELEDGKDDVQLGGTESRNGGRFRACANEKGFYDGAAQSRPTTAVDSGWNSFDDSRSTTSKRLSTFSKLHGVSTNLSGTTLDSSGTFTTPTQSMPSTKSNRLTLGFGNFPVSSFDAEIELDSLAPQERRPKSLFCQDSQRNSVGSLNRITAQNRPQSGISFIYDRPITPSTNSLPGTPPVAKNFPLSPAPTIQSNRSAEAEPTLPALPQIPLRAARRIERMGTFDGLDDNLESLYGPSWTAASTLPNMDVSSIKPQQTSCEPARGSEEKDPDPEECYSPIRDSMSSIFSDQDPMPNKLSSASRRQQVLESNPFTSIPSFNPLPPNHFHSRNTSSGSLKRTYDSVMTRLAISKDSITEEKKTSLEIERKSGPNKHRVKESGYVKEKAAFYDGRERPFDDSKAEVATRSRSSSTTSSKQKSHSKQPSIAGASDANSKSSIPTISVGRHRSSSEDSMGSISDLYGLYLKKSGAPSPVPSTSDEAGLFDLHLRTEHEQMEYEKAEKERNGLLSATAAAEGVRRKKSPPAPLVLDNIDGMRVPRAIESPVSKWKI